MKTIASGQMKSRPHTTEKPQKVANRKGNPLAGKSRLVKYDNLARLVSLNLIKPL